MAESGRLSQQAAALLDAVDILKDVQASPETVAALGELACELINKSVVEFSAGVSGKRARDFTYLYTLAALSAAVTILKNGQSVGAAISKIATATRVGRRDLRNFRDRLNRGRMDPVFMRIHNEHLAEFKGMSEAELLVRLQRLRGELCT